MGPRDSASNLARARSAWRRVRVPASCSLSGCGGGVPLLHPAHALPAGRTAFAVGVSDRFLLGDAQHALDEAASSRMPGAPSEDARARAACWSRLAEGPAVAPFAAARVGIPGHATRRASATAGRRLRADLRHAFEWGAKRALRWPRG